MYIVSDKVSSLLTKAGVIEKGCAVKKKYFDSDVVFSDLIKKGIIIEDKKTIEIKPEKIEEVKEEKKSENIFDDKKDAKK